jgi:hypothetical protein
LRLNVRPSNRSPRIPSIPGCSFSTAVARRAQSGCVSAPTALFPIVAARAPSHSMIG